MSGYGPKVAELTVSKWTGSAFTANAVVPEASFKVTKGVFGPAPGDTD
jgi:hypothetical protein